MSVWDKARGAAAAPRTPKPKARTTWKADRLTAEALRDVGRTHSQTTHNDSRTHPECPVCVKIGVDIVRAQGIPYDEFERRVTWMLENNEFDADLRTFTTRVFEQIKKEHEHGS